MTIHDLKMQVGQLTDTVSQIQFAGFVMIPSQMIPNPKGEGWAEAESGADSRLQQLTKIVVRRSEIKEDLLKLFKKVEINIPLLDAIKQIPKYAKFLKELCVHRRKKIKGTNEMGGVVLLYQSQNSMNSTKEVSRSGHIRNSMYRRQSYIHQHHAGPRSLDQRNASINIQVAQP
ncbi:hypothetical protein CR513_18827, partial [Mucuna pruriens]